jgi:aminoglycoside 6'-N-acetyltransferase
MDGRILGPGNKALARLSLRPATLMDAPLLRRWDDQPHVVASDPNDDWEWETELTRNPVWRKQLMAEVEGRPVGFVQIIDPALEDSHYWGDCPTHLRAIDIWIGEENDLGHGLGTQMMRLAIDLCFEDAQVTAILIDPLANNHRARRFYERLGFAYLEDRLFGLDECAVYQLLRERWSSSAYSRGLEPVLE